MLTILTRQIEPLSRAAECRFADEMVKHLAEFSPPLFKAIGQDGLREVIGLGTSKAGRHGLQLRGTVRLYLEMMLLFGSGFDTDPQYAWAAEVLRDRDLPEPEKAELLFGRLQHYRAAVAGPGDAYTLAALRNIRVWAQEPLRVSANDFLAAMLREVGHLYPQKAAYAGADDLAALIREAAELARKHRFATVRGAAVALALMLMLGHGCADDPLYPWIRKTLLDAAITDPAARAERLERKALIWLDHVLAYFDGSRGR